MSKYRIKNIAAWQVWSSSGLRTIEVEVRLRYGAYGRARVGIPDHNSKKYIENQNSFELQSTLRDATNFVHDEVNNCLRGNSSDDQEKIDRLLIALVPWKNTMGLTQNIVTAISLANLRAVAATEQMPLWQYLSSFLGESRGDQLPLPNVLTYNGKDNNSAPRGSLVFGLLPIGSNSFAEALINCYKVLKQFRNIGQSSNYDTIENSLDRITLAIDKTGFKPGSDFAISLLIRPECFAISDGYKFPNDQNNLSSDELCGRLVDCVERYPILSIQDPFHSEDLSGWLRFHWAVSNRIQIIKSATLKPSFKTTTISHSKDFCNSFLVSFNEIGTITNMRRMITKAKNDHMEPLLDAGTFYDSISPITHLCVGLGIKQLNINTLSDGNEGLRIANDMHKVSKSKLQKDGQLPPKSSFPWNHMHETFFSSD